MRNDWLLFFHVLVALGLVGGALTVAVVSLAARRRPGAELLLRRIALVTNLAVVLPGFIAVYVLGVALADREFGDREPDWLDVAFSITDASVIAGGVLLSALQWWVVHRTRAGRAGGWPAALASWLPLLMLAALSAVIVLMAGKPG